MTWNHLDRVDFITNAWMVMGWEDVLSTFLVELASKFNKSSSAICDCAPMAHSVPYLSSADEIVIGAGCCAQGRACLLLRTPDAITDCNIS